MEINNNFTSIGKLHNLLCDEVLSKNTSSIISTSILCEWVDICINKIHELNLSTLELEETAKKIKDYFIKYGDNKHGKSRFFTEAIYKEDFINDIKINTNCSDEFYNFLIKIHRNLLDSSCSLEDHQNILLEIHNLKSDVHKDIFLDVHNHSTQFWSAIEDNIENLSYATPPEGFTCSEWVKVVDAIGATAGIWGGVLASAIMGAIFSIAAERECVDKPIPKNKNKSKIIINFSDIYLYENVLTKYIYINNELVGSTNSNSFVLNNKNPSKQNVKVKILGGLYSSNCDIPASNKSFVISFHNKISKIFQYIIVFVSFYIILDIVLLKFLPTNILGVLLWGTLITIVLYELVLRKKRYKITIKEI